MRYSRVYLESIGYELAPVVVSTAELEARLEPLYAALKMPMGQLELLTGIVERRWWEEDFPVSHGAAVAARKALAASNLSAADIDILIYAGVCRENFEPATACRVASQLGLSSDATVYDLSNACLGVLNGIVEVANRIELGQCRAGLVVSCETAREINEVVIHQMSQNHSMEIFRQALATLTGGSGAVAVLVVDEELSSEKRRQFLAGVSKSAPQHHQLCRWGFESFWPAIEKWVPPAINRLVTPAIERVGPTFDRVVPPTIDRILATDAGSMLRKGFEMGMRHCVLPFMATDAGAVLKHGVELGLKTFKAFMGKVGWEIDQMDKVICHQVGAGHREAILNTLAIDPAKAFDTFPYLGNIGTVSLPLTAAIAEERGHLKPGDRVGFMGIGSGLNCMMLGMKW